ncbi:MAG: diguanylate cyclase, partial [Candidatus Thermoplasmatota archaeon]
MKKNPNIEVELCGIKFRNPVLTAAGPPVRNGEAILRCADGGAGGIVTKTISTKKAKPPLPCMAEIRGGFINTELWSELSPNRWLKKEYKIAKSCGLPLIISIGYSSEQISNLAPKVAKYADGLELSTHYIEPKDMVETIKTAKEIFSPVFVKFSPNITDIALFAKYAENAGADGIVAINSFGPCLSIDIENKMVMMGGTGYGWLSGQAIRPIALRFVYEIAKNVKIPVIGVGG